jgi:hypothetical protein
MFRDYCFLLASELVPTFRLVQAPKTYRCGYVPEYRSVDVGFVVDKVALGQVFLPSTSVFPCQFHSTGAPLKWKSRKKPHHLHHLPHRVAQ